MTTSSPIEPQRSEQRLFAIAARWQMPVSGLDDQSAHVLADNLSLAIEHRIALMLLDLEEIANLHLDRADGDAP